MTLAEGVALVRAKLKELNNNFWGDLQIAGFLEEGQQAMCLRKGFYQLYTAAIAITDTEVSLDAAVLSLKRVIYTKTGGLVADQEVLMEPSEYRVYGTYVRIYRTDLAGTLELICTRRPKTLSASQGFELADYYVRAGCVNYATSNCIYLADSESGSRFLNMYYRARLDWEQETANETTMLIAPDERPES